MEILSGATILSKKSVDKPTDYIGAPNDRTGRTAQVGKYNNQQNMGYLIAPKTPDCMNIIG